MQRIVGMRSVVLFDFRNAAIAGILLELQYVMTRNDAVGRSAGKLDHPRLVLDIGGVLGVGKRRAGPVLGKVAIEVAAVSGENECRRALDAQVLGSIRTTRPV